MPEQFEFGLRVAMVGWAITYGSLALIGIVIAVIRKIDDRWEQREERQAHEALQKTPTIDDTSLVLITAACATMIAGRFHIRSVRRLLPVDAKRSPWSAQGRAVLHGSHIVSRKR